MKLAVIQTGGKQYKVAEGDILKVEKLGGERGAKIVFDKVLLTAEKEDVKIGQPLIEGAKVEAEVLEQGRAKKIRVMKYKRKIRYRKVYGHRQPYTKIRVTQII